MKYNIPKDLLVEVTKKENTTSIRFDEETWAILTELCNKYKLNKSQVVRIALKNLAR